MDDDSAYYDRLGPWATQHAVRDTLHASDAELASMRASRDLLGVDFGGQFYYPVHQFKDGSIVAGLRLVLTALSAGFASFEGQVAWLSEPAYENSALTRWEVLHRDVHTVHQWAAEDAAAACR